MRLENDAKCQELVFIGTEIEKKKKKEKEKSSFKGTNSFEVKSIILQYKQIHEKQTLCSVPKWVLETCFECLELKRDLLLLVHLP